MLSRRRFLAGLGASTLASPFVRFLHGGEAYAGSGQARRLLVFFTPNGQVPQRLWPEGSGSDFNFPSGSVWEPLAPIADQLTILRGLDFFEATNHEGGMAAMLTGGGGATTESQGMSIDQYIAAHIGGATRFPSMEFGVQTSAWGGSIQTRMSYAGPGEYVTPDDNPANAFDRMFGDLLGDSDGLARLRSRRQSVIDLARDELIDLHLRLGAAERIKLEAHLEALHSMEQGLQSTNTCEPGTPPSGTGLYDNDRFPEIGRAQTDLAISALACGLTNVASIQWSHTVGPTVFSWVGASQGHHSLSHISDSDSAGVEEYVQCERWLSEQFLYTVEQLQALPDPEGEGSLLDNTLVVWAQEMGDGRLHVCEDVPFILAGPAGGFLTPGRYLDFGGTSHNPLLVSICHAFGLSNQTFGNPAAGTGPLEGLS